MKKTHTNNENGEARYQKKNGDVFVRFVKPIRLARKMIYKNRSIVFQVPI